MEASLDQRVISAVGRHPAVSRGSVAEAVDVYREARAAVEQRLDYEVPRELEAAVADAVEQAR